MRGFEGHLAHAEGRSDAALLAFEDAIALAHESDSRSHELAPAYLDFARALAQHRELSLAKDQAELALQLATRDPGAKGQPRGPYHEVLSEIAVLLLRADEAPPPPRGYIWPMKYDAPA